MLCLFFLLGSSLAVFSRCSYEAENNDEKYVVHDISVRDLKDVIVKFLEII